MNVPCIHIFNGFSKHLSPMQGSKECLYLNMFSLLGSTLAPCTGVWTIVACGTSNGDLRLCNPGGDGNYVREVSVAQLAPGASCQYAAIEKRSISSGEFGYYSYDIWTKGTCVGIFNVCTGKLSSMCQGQELQSFMIVI